MTKQEELEKAIKNNDNKKAQLLLLDPSVYPAGYNNYAICWASEKGHTEVVKLILLDPRVDPSDYNNYAIRFTNENKHNEVIQLLWKNKNVKSSLKNDDLNLFNSLTQLDIKEKIKLF